LCCDAAGDLTSEGVNTYSRDSDNNSVNIGGVGLTFDAFDRVVEQNRGGSYTQIVYGPGGNRLALMSGQTNGPCPNWTFNSNNQINTSGFTYDPAGNLLSDGTHSYEWDAEGRMKSVDGGANTQVIYSALGWRVYDFLPNGWMECCPGQAGAIDYLHDAAGQSIGGVWGGGGNQWVFMGERILADYESDGVHLLHPNAVNTSTQTTDWTGGNAQTSLVYPWGQGWAGSPGWIAHGTWLGMPDGDPYPPLGQALYRRYSPEKGRWMSPDPAGQDAADPSDPQTWNMYAYVRNNPTTLTDPDGERYNVCQTDANGNQANCADISDEQFAQFEQANKDTLTFTGNGNVLQSGTVIGSYEQTSVDLSPDAQQIFTNVHNTAAGPVNFFFNRTMDFLTIAGPGILSGAGTMPEVGTSIGRGLVSAGTKAAARDALEDLAISDAQKATVKRAIQRATTSEKVSIDRLADGSIRVLRTRPGATGSQTFAIVVDAAGNSQRVQVAVDSAGAVVHYDIK
jgi:RHS repeat-associated protein